MFRVERGVKTGLNIRVVTFAWDQEHRDDDVKRETVIRPEKPGTPDRVIPATPDTLVYAGYYYNGCPVYVRRPGTPARTIPGEKAVPAVKETDHLYEQSIVTRKVNVLISIRKDKEDEGKKLLKDTLDFSTIFGPPLYNAVIYVVGMKVLTQDLPSSLEASAVPSQWTVYYQTYVWKNAQGQPVKRPGQPMGYVLLRPGGDPQKDGTPFDSIADMEKIIVDGGKEFLGYPKAQ